MNTIESIACLRTEAENGDVAAFLPLADELCEQGHPRGAECVELAVIIATETDWAVVTMAIALFLKLLEEN